MYHKKHQKKRYHWIQALFILFFISLVALELYLLFFNTTPHSPSKHLTTETTRKLTTDANKRDDFNQKIEPSTPLAQQIEQKLTDSKFVGTALVVQNGQIILQKGFGYANYAKKLPNTYQSIFQIGSIQKALTAVLILKQVELGTLSLDETLNQFYPNIPDSQKITIRQLLSMNSGLCQKIKPKHLMSPDGFLQFAISHATMETYGKFKYDAINYYLLVGILEQLTDTAYQTLFYQTFTQHLQLSHTLFYTDFLTANNRTYAYEKAEGKNFDSEINDNPLLFEQEVGTGSVGMTVGDLYLFYANLLSGKIIDHQVLERLWTPATENNYIGGIYNFSTYIQGHGVEEGFETNSFTSKDTRNAVILFTNQYPKNRTYQDLAKSLFQSLH
ncbi:serine hydrolase domain-containing protein [Candidatus Enterococcus mansonii]|uniref:Beta-lactamase-related domain-containing protein n=1 Tax=Candidatus Enterococcus mansonii TaxID=1834181 RepID=A0A242CHT8_9ENTE|nr:serine hydrolase domain-containing protein [Enterococcus sp. 4G2_DIV0659]OTO09795.1 hypothetical protein A5880_000478 [Enterococcus sp. 4G2_DIV0659]